MLLAGASNVPREATVAHGSFKSVTQASCTEQHPGTLPPHARRSMPPRSESRCRRYAALHLPSKRPAVLALLASIAWRRACPHLSGPHSTPCPSRGLLAQRDLGHRRAGSCMRTQQERVATPLYASLPCSGQASLRNRVLPPRAHYLRRIPGADTCAACIPPLAQQAVEYGGLAG